MAVETLLDPNKIQIKQIHGETLESTPGLQSKQLFQDLKETDLYDQDNNLWYSSMSHYQYGRSKYQYSGDQLLGIFLETQFDKKEAYRQYEQLQQTSHYSPERHLWNQKTYTEDLYLQTVYREDTNILASDQLLGIATESVFDKKVARQHYIALKKSSLYDADSNLWYDKKSDKENEYDTTDQLLSIFVEGIFDKKSARQQYEILKQTAFYDNDAQTWNPGIKHDQTPYTEFRAASDLLLGILVESMFDMNQAKKQYETLKSTNLYDEKYKQWNSAIGTGSNRPGYSREAFNQLLGVFIETTFETADIQEKQQRHASKEEQLPEMRRF